MVLISVEERHAILLDLMCHGPSKVPGTEKFEKSISAGFWRTTLSPSHAENDPNGDGLEIGQAVCCRNGVIVPESYSLFHRRSKNQILWASNILWRNATKAGKIC